MPVACLVPNECVCKRVDAGEVSSNCWIELVAGGKRIRREVRDPGLPVVIPDQYFEWEIEGCQRCNLHHRSSLKRATEDHQCGIS